MTMALELHPLCTLFPRLVGAEFDALVEDISANGLQQPITVHDGMVLDGGNRYAACLAAGIEPVLRDFDGADAVAFVLSANLHRRHLSPGQQAAIVASAQDWAMAQTVGKPAARQSGNVAGLATIADRAAQSGASERTQRMADKVAKADPALAKQVAHGIVSLPKAVEQITGKPVNRSAPSAPAVAGESPVIDELREQVAILAEENDRLNERLAVEAMDASEEERTAAAELIAGLRHQVAVLSAELDAVKNTRNSLMVENRELKVTVQSLQRQLKKVAA